MAALLVILWSPGDLSGYSSSTWIPGRPFLAQYRFEVPPETDPRSDARRVVSIDILVQSRRNRRAAIRFFRKLLKGQGCVPRRLITDKLRSYLAACRTVMPSVVHRTDRYANNRAEVSHQPTRERERQMRRFKSAAHTQRFLAVHGPVQNLFRVGRHLLRAVHHRLLRTQAFGVWREVTCA